MDITEHHVRERAYYIWEAEGRVAGRADAHWNQAVIEIAAGFETAAKAARKAPRAKAAAKAPVTAAAKAPAKPKKAAPSSKAGVALH